MFQDERNKGGNVVIQNDQMSNKNNILNIKDQYLKSDLNYLDINSNLNSKNRIKSTNSAKTGTTIEKSIAESAV